MKNQFSVTLVDDTGLSLDCEVLFDHHRSMKCDKNQSMVYFYSSENSQVEVHIRKEDKWSNRHIVNKAFMLLFSLDLVWGNLADSDNLPIGVDFKGRLQCSSGKKCANITLGKILHVERESLKSWSKCILAQKIEILLLVVWIAGAFSFLFTGVYKIIPLALAFLIDAILHYGMKKRYAKIYSTLLVLLQAAA